jgi:hypothetical protein
LSSIKTDCTKRQNSKVSPLLSQIILSTNHIAQIGGFFICSGHVYFQQTNQRHCGL